MRLRGKVLIAALLVAGLAGCGEDSTKTVVQTAPPPPAAPTETVPATTTLPSEPVPTEAPPANMPAGAIAVQGRFKMRLIKETNKGTADSPENSTIDRESLWVAKTSCASTCQVELRRELPRGGFETVTLDQVEGDPTRYATEGKVKANYCANADGAIGTARRRISLKISATADVDGQPAAVRLDGYFVARQRCSILSDKSNARDGSSTVLFRGSASGA